MTGYRPSDTDGLTLEGTRIQSLDIAFSACFLDQDPTGDVVDVPTQMIFSGVDVITPKVTIHANGDVEFHEAGTYRIALSQTMGRTGSSSVARLITWGEFTPAGGSAVQVVPSVEYEFENPNNRISLLFANFGDLQAGDKISAWFARDGSGANDGGMKTREVSATLAGLGVLDVASATMAISQLVLAEV